MAVFGTTYRSIAGTGARLSGSAQAAGLKRIGQGYSRFVATMKLVLPLIAAVMIALLAAWPQFQSVPQRFSLGATEMIGLAASGHRLTNARFSGTDRNDNPYTLTAEALVQRNPGSDEVILRRPEADFTTAAGSWVAVSAPNGRFTRKEQRIVLDGGVNLFHDSGYELRTEGISVDFRGSTARSSDPVVGHGPAANLKASGFELFGDGKRIVFNGPARVVLFAEPSEAVR